MTDRSKGAAWMTGEIVSIDAAGIGVTARGVTRSDISHVAPVIDGGFSRLDDCIRRFMASTAAVRMDTGIDMDAIRAACHAIVARSGLRDAYRAICAALRAARRVRDRRATARRHPPAEERR